MACGNPTCVYTLPGLFEGSEQRRVMPTVSQSNADRQVSESELHWQINTNGDILRFAEETYLEWVRNHAGMSKECRARAALIVTCHYLRESEKSHRFNRTDCDTHLKLRELDFRLEIVTRVSTDIGKQLEDSVPPLWILKSVCSSLKGMSECCRQELQVMSWFNALEDCGAPEAEAEAEADGVIDTDPLWRKIMMELDHVPS